MPKPNSFLYYLFSTFSFLLLLFNWLLIKLSGFLAFIGIVTWLGKSWTLLGVVACLFTYGIVFKLTQQFAGKNALQLERFGLMFRKRLSNKYGNDFNPPTFEKFDLIEQDYYAYNRRFQIDISLVLITSTAVLLWASNPYFKTATYNQKILIILGIVAILIILYYVIKAINLHISKRYPQHDKVSRYIHELKVYKKIQVERKADSDAAIDWEP